MAAVVPGSNAFNPALYRQLFGREPPGDSPGRARVPASTSPGDRETAEMERQARERAASAAQRFSLLGGRAALSRAGLLG